MTKNFTTLGILFLFYLIGFSQQPTSITFMIQKGQTPLCSGSLLQILAIADPPNNYNYTWNTVGGGVVFNEDGSTASGGPTVASFIQVRPTTTNPLGETITYEVQINGITNRISIDINPENNAGIDSSIFLCGKTGIIDLFNELDGSPQTGGVWSNGTGTYDTSNPAGGVFSYTIDNGGACPVSVTTVTLKPCANNDPDNDGIPNSTDIDNDNDGIPNTVEDGFCNAASLTPVFVLEEDFGFGGPTRSRFVDGTGLTFTSGIPQDTGSDDGQYNVSTSSHILATGAYGIFVATDLTGNLDANGDLDGRYMSINMKTPSFLNKPIFIAKDLPVIPGVEYDFSMAVASLSNETSEVSPSLRIEVIDQNTPTVALFSEDTGEIPNATDQWITYGNTFIPGPATTVVTIQVVNVQTTGGNGNDVGIDNIFLSRQQCDFDRDGIPNSEDLDSDNDGIYDIVENGQNGLDADNDGRVDVLSNQGTITATINSDPDSNPDFLDIDSDNDGIVDIIEAQPTASFTAPTGIDGNFNGVDDAYDTPTSKIVPIITIGGNADYINTNVDNDCLDDNIEGYDENRNGAIDGTEKAFTSSDADKDGLDDGYDTIVLGRLTGFTNAPNNLTPDDLLNNHNPETAEKDWREVFSDIGPIDVTIGTLSCASVNLYDDLIDIFKDSPLDPPTNGIWSVPGTKALAGTPSYLGTLDPTDIEYVDGNYVYTIPAFSGTSCSEQKITLNVTIDNMCKCPPIAAPSKVGTDPTTCIDATTLPTLTVATPPAGLEARWLMDDEITLLADNTTTFTPTRTDISVGNTTIKAQFFDPVRNCPGEFVEFIVTATAPPEAGTVPSTPLQFCDDGMVSSASLFALLTGADSGGTWTSPSSTPLGVTFPDTAAENGDYEYSITRNGCTDTAIVTVEITTKPNLTVRPSDITCNAPIPSTTYEVSYTLTGVATVTSNFGTIDPVNFKVTNIPKDQDIIITATSTTNSTCIFNLPITAPDCNCPPIAAPSKIGTDPTTCIDATTLPTLTVATPPAGLEARWLMDDEITLLVDNSTTFTPTGTDISIGNTTIKAQFYNPITNCSSTFIEFIVTATASPEAGTSPTTSLQFCDDGLVSSASLFALLTGADSGGTWTSPSSVPLGTTFPDTAAENGNYEYSITRNGCTDTATITVEITPKPNLTVRPVDITCDAPLSSPTSTYEVIYTLTRAMATVTSNFGTVDQSSFKITGIPKGQDIIITATSTLNNTCIFNLPVTAPDCNCPTIALPTNPINQSICESDPIPSISVTIPSGLVGRWYRPDGSPIASAQNTSSYTPNLSDLEIGNNTFKVEAYNSTLGCTSTMIDVTLTIDGAPNAGKGPSTVTQLCRNSNSITNLFTLLDPKTIGGNSPETGGTWRLPGGTIFDGNISPTNTLFNTGMYTYTVTSSICASDIAIVNVEIIETPTPVVPVIASSFCTTATVPNYTGSNQKYFTRPNGGGIELQPGQTLVNTTTIFLRESNGLCFAEEFFVINIENVPEITISDPESVCVNDSGDLLSNTTIEVPANLDPSLYNFQWLNNNTPIPGATGTTYSIDQIGSYSLAYSQNFGANCSSTSNSVSVKTLSSPILSGIQKEGNTVTIIAEGDELEYSLNNSSFQTSNVFTSVPFGKFTATVRNKCDEISLEDELFGFPAFFTPNNDGENDFWNVQGTDEANFKISVFDRYGNVIAIFNPQDNGWDGKYGNKDMPGDDYWYYAINSNEEYRGHFSLVR